MHKLMVLLLIITLAVIEFLANTTTVHIKIVESMWDKANHFSAFFVLFILLSLAFKEMKIVIKVILLLSFGLQIEIVQYFIEGRDFSLMDVVADFIGILIGMILYKLYNVFK